MMAVLTWLHVRYEVVKTHHERGFVVAENIGYVVMGILVIIAVGGVVQTGLLSNVGKWITEKVFQN